MRVDVHQHIWTTPLLEALATRARLPFVRRSEGATVLHCAGERPYRIDVDAEMPSHRQALLRTDGVDLALVALSSPVGIEALPRRDSLELIQAHLDGTSALGAGFAGWGPVPLDQPEPADVDRVLAKGCLGVSLPAGALLRPESLLALGPVLERIAEREVPLFIHPGRGPGSHGPEAPSTEPLWWRALTDYVAQMQAAWLTFVTAARREHPHLTVLFTMLAGGAPLLSERLGARGGPRIELRDPLIFYDTSSYGPAAIKATARVVGASQLLYGSDRPVIEPVPSGNEAILQTNGARFVKEVGVSV
jgi:hypothetical protein